MKKVLFLFSIGLLLTNSIEAKTIDTFNYSRNFNVGDSIPALFPGGSEAWVEYLNSKLNYNVPINNNAPIGQYPINYRFKIDTVGKITDLIFDNDPGYGIKEEVTRVLNHKKMPKWSPASINGELVFFKVKHSLTFYVN